MKIAAIYPWRHHALNFTQSATEHKAELFSLDKNSKPVTEVAISAENSANPREKSLAADSHEPPPDALSIVPSGISIFMPAERHPEIPSFISLKSVYPAAAARRAASSDAVQSRLWQ